MATSGLKYKIYVTSRAFSQRQNQPLLEMAKAWYELTPERRRCEGKGEGKGYGC